MAVISISRPADSGIEISISPKTATTIFYVVVALVAMAVAVPAAIATSSDMYQGCAAGCAGL